MKYLFITLKVQDGEHEHTHRVLTTCMDKQNVLKAADNYAKTYYDGKPYKEDDFYFFDAGCIAVKVQNVEVLTEYEYNLMSKIFSGEARPGYFEIVHAGYQSGIDREEIQVHAGENGNIYLIKTDEGMIVDIYGQNDLVDTLAIFEDEFDPKDPDEDKKPEVQLPDGVNDFDISEFKKQWGQNHVEICNNLGYAQSHSQSDELLMVDYFYDDIDKHWYPKMSSMYTEKEQAIADYLRNK